jgi:transmembrane sensor
MTEPSIPEPLMRDAIAWTVRVGDPDFADWEAFQTWLAASPAHADAYHLAATAEADVVASLAAARPVAVVRPPKARRWAPWAGAALAASLAGVVAYQWQAPAPVPIVYETAPGAQRTIKLADGSGVILNGATRLIVDGGSTRALTLAHGEALFTVRHDEARPFRVSVGGADVVDVGTRFDIVRDGGATQVAVSEGAVDWRRDGNAVRVDAGNRLRVRDGSANVELAAMAPGAVGGWTAGQLDYDGAPLSEVAADVARTLGVTLSADPAVAGRPVRGVVRLDGGADAVVPRLAALTGVHARRDGRIWRLTASP